VNVPTCLCRHDALRLSEFKRAEEFEVVEPMTLHWDERDDLEVVLAAWVVSCQANGRHYVAVASGNSARTGWHTTGNPTLFIFGL
jgi:hypothetical protein